MRDAIWIEMLDADMNVRYWKALAQRYAKRDRLVKIFLAITTSGTVAGWAVWEARPYLSYLWKFLSGLSALVAISQPYFKYQATIKDVSYLSGKWWEQLTAYEDLWRRIENGDVKGIEKRFADTKKKEMELVRKETTLPNDVKLAKKCQAEVNHSRCLA